MTSRVTERAKVQEKVAVEAVVVYEDAKRKVECVHFEGEHFGVRFTNKGSGKVTKVGLSKEAAQAVGDGFRVIFSEVKPVGVRVQKFIMDDAPEYVWTQVRE